MRWKRSFGAVLVAALSLVGVTEAVVGDRASADTGPARVATTAQNHSVFRLYRAYFLRDPDARGQAYWAREFSSRRMSLASISQSFSQSKEFVDRYGALSHTDFVELVYENVLGRSPDASGLAHWVGALEIYPHRGSVMVGFSESAEFQARTDTVPPEVHPAPSPSCGSGCVPAWALNATISCWIPVYGSAPVKGGTGIEPYLEEYADITGIVFVPGTLAQASASGLVIRHEPAAEDPLQLGLAASQLLRFSDGSRFIAHTTITLYEGTVSPWTIRHELAHALGLDHSRTPLMSPASDTSHPGSADIRPTSDERAHLAGLGRRSGCR